MKLEASADLLISQWRAAPKMHGMTAGIVGIVQEDVADSFDQIFAMLDIETAEGVWLDFLAKRVGIDRPLITNSDDDDRFGWRGPSQAMGFDSAPFRGELATADKYPLPDITFRKFVKARGILDKTGGDFPTFQRACHAIDSDSQAVDNRNMTVTIKTSLQDEFQLADTIGALPRAAGVQIIYTEFPTFGMKGAGEGFDRVRMR